MKKITSVLVVLCALSLGACKDDKAGGGGAKAGGKKAAASGPIKLDKLGLQITAPGATASKAIMGDGMMLRGGAVVAMTVEVAGKSFPKDLKAAKEDASMYSPKSPKEEKLADGWAYTFSNKGGMGTNYFVKVRRTIGGKDYACTTTGNSAAQQAAVLAACKSLKK